MSDLTVRDDEVRALAADLDATAGALATDRIVGPDLASPALQPAVDELLAVAGHVVDDAIDRLRRAATGATTAVATMAACDAAIAALARAER